MCCWDLKEFDYGHYDVMNNKLVYGDDTDIHKSKSVIMNTESYE